ncbi:MAG: flagellar basal body-associated FliL family protein [Gallionella sp.]|nr:flagellar basal body-associated FliL family protein [Gallionella sp.]
MSKTAKPAAPQTTDTPPPKKSKKKLIMAIAVLALLIGGGAAAFLLMKPAHLAKPDEAGVVAEEALPDVPSIYVQLGTFTANLIHEEGDRYLQVAIELKITQPELAGKIKATNPEILHRVNMLLQSKRPSELATFDGKQRLAEQIKAQVEYVLGLRKTAPAITEPEAPGAEGTHAAQAAPTKAQDSKSGISDVLFTAFIIQ